jgi:hypothetical protein
MAVLRARIGGTMQIIGLPGPQGPKGATGPAGAVGDKGATGTTGAVGDKGAKGATGPPGDKGNTGPGGATGAQGAKGNNHYWQIRMGSPSITPVANTNTALNVYYAAAFRVAPTVVVSARSSVIGTTVRNVSVNTPQTSYFTLYIYRTNTTATTVDYLAVGER